MTDFKLFYDTSRDNGAASSKESRLFNFMTDFTLFYVTSNGTDVFSMKRSRVVKNRVIINIMGNNMLFNDVSKGNDVILSNSKFFNNRVNRSGRSKRNVDLS